MLLSRNRTFHSTFLFLGALPGLSLITLLLKFTRLVAVLVLVFQVHILIHCFISITYRITGMYHITCDVNTVIDGCSAICVYTQHSRCSSAAMFIYNLNMYMRLINRYLHRTAAQSRY